LSGDIDAVLVRITLSHLERYKALLDDLSKKNVASDLGYQRIFNGFYKMQRRSKDWYRYYFSLLEGKKADTSITFKDVIGQIHSDKGRIEPSFSSKLVATIRPEKPVYDKYVRENLSLKVPGAHMSAQDKVEGFITMYASLEEKIAGLVKNPVFTKTLRPAFDKKLRTYAHFTDVKKLDFLLWQHRDANKKA
jgi:hypothetical protein